MCIRIRLAPLASLLRLVAYLWNFEMNLIKVIPFLFPVVAVAGSYSVTGSWQDTTPTSSNYQPSYKAEWRLNSGAVTSIPALASPAFATTITAEPADILEARVQNCNVVGGGNLCSEWSGWIQATVPFVPTQPANPSGVSIVVTPQ